MWNGSHSELFTHVAARLPSTLLSTRTSSYPSAHQLLPTSGQSDVQHPAGSPEQQANAADGSHEQLRQVPLVACVFRTTQSSHICAKAAPRN
eukprot:5083966-Amphidinium_carterae.1